MKRLLLSMLTSLTVLCATDTTSSEEELHQRIEFIRQHFDTTVLASKGWQYGWSGFYAGVIAWDADTYSRSDDPLVRYDMTVDMILTGSGLGDMLLFPLPSHNAAAKLREMPAASEEELREKLRLAELLLQQSADEESRRTGLNTHLLSIASGFVGGAAIAAKEERYSQGLLYFASVVVSTELKIATTPTASVDARNRYLQHFSHHLAPKPKKSYDVRLVALPSSVMLTVSF